MLARIVNNGKPSEFFPLGRKLTSQWIELVLFSRRVNLRSFFVVSAEINLKQKRTKVSANKSYAPRNLSLAFARTSPSLTFSLFFELWPD